MKCPVDQADLVTVERQGVSVEHCPTCRGVWLDRGELDKIIEKATPPVVLPDPDPVAEAEPEGTARAKPIPPTLEEPGRPKPRNRRYAGRYSRKIIHSILDEIFDFD